jgi:biotin carboxyl carrier protein
MNPYLGGCREYSAVIGGRERTVRVEPDGEGLRVRVDGEEFHVVSDAQETGESCLLLNGRPQVVNVRRESEGSYRVMLGGIERSVRILPAGSSRADGAHHAIRSDAVIEIRSPMHGMVVAVQVEEGEEIEEEAPLLVLEAMKMQNAITSPIRGRVKTLLVRPGLTVEGEALLAVLERIALPATTEGKGHR